MWYHGTAEYHKFKGKFKYNPHSKERIINLKEYYVLQKKLKTWKGNHKGWLDILQQISKCKEKYKYEAIFFTDNIEVARTYANSSLSFHYESVSKIIKAELDCDSIITVDASGNDFFKIPHQNVRKAFKNHGHSDINEVLLFFGFYSVSNKDVSTDTLAAIGHYYGYDCVEIINVNDNYNSSKDKSQSTERIILDHRKIKI